jgi:hypothetical protein
MKDKIFNCLNIFVFPIVYVAIAYVIAYYFIPTFPKSIWPYYVILWQALVIINLLSRTNNPKEI